MKFPCRSLAVLLLAGACWAQGFDSGSDGSDGPLVVPAGQTQTLLMPPDGVFHFTTVTIEAGATLSFTPNELNTPVYLLASGEVLIRGRIDVSGEPGTSNPPIGGAGGPGGFAGGNPGVGAGNLGGNGFGPGAGARASAGNSAGGAGHGSIGSGTGAGAVYGSQLLQPLAGGSGGGGAAGSGSASAGIGGGGGGGAILIAANSAIRLLNPGTGQSSGILADGGSGGGGGSGGAVRLVAPVVQTTSNTVIQARNPQAGTGLGLGRIRIDTITRNQLVGASYAGVVTIGGFLVARLPDLPTLEVLSVAEVPLNPLGPNQIILPFNAPNMQMVVVRASGFTGVVPARLVVTPDAFAAAPLPYDFDINGAGGAPVDIPILVTLPANAVNAIHVWTR